MMVSPRQTASKQRPGSREGSFGHGGDENGPAASSGPDASPAKLHRHVAKLRILDVARWLDDVRLMSPQFCHSLVRNTQRAWTRRRPTTASDLRLIMLLPYLFIARSAVGRGTRQSVAPAPAPASAARAAPSSRFCGSPGTHSTRAARRSPSHDMTTKPLAASRQRQGCVFHAQGSPYPQTTTNA